MATYETSRRIIWNALLRNVFTAFCYVSCKSSFEISFNLSGSVTKVKLPTLYNRRLQDIAILMYKIKNGLCPNYLYRLFISRSNQHNLRNNDFVVPRVNTTGYGKHSVRYLGPVLWSKIDWKFRELKTLYEFKGKIRMVDLAKHILANNCINCTLCHS